MEFFASAVDTLKVLVMAIGCGLRMGYRQPLGRLRSRQPCLQCSCAVKKLNQDKGSQGYRYTV